MIGPRNGCILDAGTGAKSRIEFPHIDVAKIDFRLFRGCTGLHLMLFGNSFDSSRRFVDRQGEAAEVGLVDPLLVPPR